MTMATNTGHVMNLANSIIGVSLLAMPFCFKQCGITLAIVMLILSSIISRLACHFLVKSSTMCRRRNFEFLAFYTFGPSGKLLVELGVIGFMMGTCVAFFVVMGDLGPAIISKIFHINNSSTLRTSVLIGLGVLVVLPLGLLRSVESLAAISTVTITYYILFILKIFFESSPHLITGDWWQHVKFWQPEGALQCIPIFAMALSCQTQVFEIYNSLHSPTIEKMNSVVHSALNLCTIVYTSVGLLGYIAYCKGSFTGNILLSFTPSLSSEMFKLGFVLSIAVSFPLVIFPCRASLFSLIFKRMPIHHELSQTSSHIPDSRFKCLTVIIVTVALITGLLIPSIELVLGFLGSTIGIAICVIFPSLSFLNLCNKNTNERVLAKVTLLLGVLIMITGTFGNLFAAVEHKAIQQSPGKMSDSKSLPIKLEASTEMAKTHNNKEVLLINPIPPEKFLPVKPVDGVKPRGHLTENVRKEPPIPVAPALNKETQNGLRPQIQLIESHKASEEKGKNLFGKIEGGSKKPKNFSLTDKINKDAIEKEEREIMEVEKQKKTEEDKKQEELLKILKEHQDEQKKLLREQEKILTEMKNRESEKKSRGVGEEVKDSNFIGKEVKTIKPEEFKKNINKIQNFIENLKDTKNILEKEKAMDSPKNFVAQTANISHEGGNKMGKGGGQREELRTGKGEKSREVEAGSAVDVSKVSQGEREWKNPIVSMPLPLAKLKPQSEMQKEKQSRKEASKSKQEVLARDILVEKVSGREKREVERRGTEGGECAKNAQNGEGNSILNFDPKNKTEIIKLGEGDNREISGDFFSFRNSSVLIKNSVHLSVGLPREKKSKMTDLESDDFFSQPFVSNKRDLKSVHKDDN